MGYRFIEHTSDMIIEADGKTFGEAFESLAQGMFTQMGEAKPKEKFELKAGAGTLEELVVNSLSELLAEIEIQRFTPAKVEVKKFGGDGERKTLEFSVYGEPKVAKNIIKAVTFHELLVREENGKWTLRVLFDI